MGDNLPTEFGERVRFARQRGRQTQAVVAGLSGISADYLYQIERGKKLPTLPVAMQLARVLKVSVTELLGEAPRMQQHEKPVDASDAIHRALTEPVITAAADDVELDHRLRAAWQCWQSSLRRYSQLTGRLPSLITAIEQTRRSEKNTRRSRHRAVDLYSLVRTVAKRVGRLDLALLAADRGLAIAETADDPIRIGAARWNLAHVLLAQGP